MKGVIFDIKHFSVHDGPGIRTTVFFKGCPLRCIWCHNPEGQLLEPENFTRVNMLEGTEFKVDSQAGNIVTAGDVMQEIEKDRVFYEESGGGVTFSGGEPFARPVFLFSLLEKCNEAGIHTAIDTCGYAGAGEIKTAIPLTNLFLFDLKLANKDEHEKYTGVSNKRILENLKIISSEGKEIFIRIPLVEDITDTEKNLTGLREIMLEHPGITRIDLLPRHNIAVSKYKRFGKKVYRGGEKPYNREKSERIRDFFLEKFPVVTIGG